MSGLCRCCLSEGEFRSLDAPYKCDGNDSYSTLLRETFNINMSPMPGPDNASTYTICGRCMSQLQDAAKFRNQVLESEKKFAAYRENYLRGDAEIKHISSIVKEEVETDNYNAMAMSPDEGNDYFNEFDSKIDVCDDGPKEGNDDDYINEYDYKIDVCDNDFQSDKKIEERTKPETKHINRDGNRKVDERYACDFCKEIFCLKDILRSHVVAMHMSQDSWDFSCPSCDITFNGRNSLKKHMMLKHETAKYHCAFCIDTFPTFDSVKTHELTHTKKSGYICDYCQKSFKLKETLKKHIYLHTQNNQKYTKQERYLKVNIRSVHDKIRPLKCEKCPKTYKSKWNLTEHIRVAHTGKLPYECNVCLKRFRSKSGFNTHKLRHLLMSVGPSTPRRTSTEIKQDQARTATEMRPDNLNNECPICGKRFVYKSHLKRHSYTHTKRFKCHVCGEDFSNKRRLRTHMLRRHDTSKEKQKQEGNTTKATLKYQKERKLGNIVIKSIDKDVYFNSDNGDGKMVSADDGDGDYRTNKSRYSCDFCEEIFCGTDKLISHVQAKHISQDSRHFYCSSCDKMFKRRNSLRRHMMLNHVRAEYHCAFCTDTFPTLNSLKTHKRTHTKKSTYICDYCQKSFKNKRYLKRHIFQHTGNYKDYICDYCQKSYKHKESLQRHIYHHTGNYNKYICHTCGLITKQASYLKVHIRNVHEKIKPFKCDLCPKTYVAKQRLIDHRRVHTGEPPYECDVCFKRFLSKPGFNTHKLQHLLMSAGPSTPRRTSTEIKQDQARTGTEMRPDNLNNECPICSKRFVYKSHLKRHSYVHTKSFKCHVCGEDFSNKRRRLRTHMLRKHGIPKENRKKHNESKSKIP